MSDGADGPAERPTSVLGHGVPQHLRAFAGGSAYDRYARLVQRALGVPVALVSLVGDDRQVFPGMLGLPEPWSTLRETPLTHSFCQYVVYDRRPLVIEDARLDERLRSNQAIEDLGVVAYAGFPLHDHTGTVIGSLCAIEHTPRRWSAEDLEVLADLAHACSADISASLLRHHELGCLTSQESLDLRSRVLLALADALADTSEAADVAAAVGQVASEQLGCLRAGIWLRERTDPTTLPWNPTSPQHTLSWVRDPGASVLWEQAERYARVQLDGSTPAALVAMTGGPLFYETRRAQNEEFAALAHPSQVGERRAYLPLISQGRLHGALVLIWPDAGPVLSHERLTLGAFAASVSQALQRAALSQDRRDALLTLQRSLIPDRLPSPARIELAARYRPATALDQVGGDWYDALELDPDVLELVVGDVAGHDIAAAATMGQIRTTLRALAHAIDDTPARQVSRLDQVMAAMAITDMSTLVLGRLEKAVDGSHRFRWANAGHMPPLLLGADGSVRWLHDDRRDLPVGIDPGAGRRDHEATVAPGSTLLLFTDGLVEQRREVLDVGLGRLADSARRHAALPLEDLLDAVVADLLGDGPQADDLALLAARLPRP